MVNKVFGLYILAFMCFVSALTSKAFAGNAIDDAVRLYINEPVFAVIEYDGQLESLYDSIIKASTTCPARANN